MPSPRVTPEEIRARHGLARQWPKIASRRAFGDDGPGLDADVRTFEPRAAAAAHGLTEGALERLLEQPAGKRPDEQPCPTCGGRCPTEPHTRSLTARGAEVEHVEPIAHRPGGRRDGFPPADGSGAR